jgi:molybdate transport system substrate-binding protein
MRSLLLILLLFPVAKASELRICAAASLTEAITEISTFYQKKTLITPQLNLAASNILARQIEAGAPADVFFSADERTIQQLHQKQLLDPATITPLLSNRLVVIIPHDSHTQIRSASDLTQPSIRRIALGDPVAVPAGIYAQAWLEKEQVWSSLQKRIVGMESVRGALAAVASADADAGIVYQTDAAISPKVKIAFTAPSNAAILYSAAVCKSSKQPAIAREFISFLQQPECQLIFQKHGFIVLQPTPEK